MLIDINGATIQQVQNIHSLQVPTEPHQDRPYPGPKNKPQNFKRIEILYSVFSDHNRIKLEIINRETK